MFTSAPAYGSCQFDSILNKFCSRDISAGRVLLHHLHMDVFKHECPHCKLLVGKFVFSNLPMKALQPSGSSKMQSS